MDVYHPLLKVSFDFGVADPPPLRAENNKNVALVMDFFIRVLYGR